MTSPPTFQESKFLLRLQPPLADQKVAPDEDKRIGAESVSLSFPADHQKSIVIDYGYEGAHGYLMVHNSLTDYWDTVGMKHDDPRRELGKT